MPPSVAIHLVLDRAGDLDELEVALLRARATELSEVRRRQVRLTAGYGDATTRDVMDDEGARAQRRYDALTRLLEAVRLARAEPGTSSPDSAGRA